MFPQLPPAQRWEAALAAMASDHRRRVLAAYADRHGDVPIDVLAGDVAERIAARAEEVALAHPGPADGGRG